MTVAAFLDLATGLDPVGVGAAAGLPVLGIDLQAGSVTLPISPTEVPVVGVDGDAAAAAAREAAIHAGVEAPDVGVVRLDHLADAHGRERVLAAAAALAARVGRARSWSPVPPEGIAVERLAGSAVSRRSLLRPRELVRHKTVALVDVAKCAAPAGCSACVAACPVDAVTFTPAAGRDRGGSVHVDARACVACGLCRPPCPQGVIEVPRATPAEARRELAGLLRLAPPPQVVIFVREREHGLLRDATWRGAAPLVVDVPCTGALEVELVLDAFTWGASGVVVAECGPDCPCRSRPDTAAGFLAAARSVLAAFDVAPGRLLPAHPGEELGLVGVVEAVSTLAALPPVADAAAKGDASGGVAAAALRLATALTERPPGQRPAPVEGVNVHCGLVDVDREACTLCGVCSQVCPTSALSQDEDGRCRLRFDPRHCSACGVCAAWCPEKAVSVRPVLDVDALEKGSAVLLEDEMVTCVECGAPLGPAAMVAAVRRRVRVSPAPAPDRCPECRLT